MNALGNFLKRWAAALLYPRPLVGLRYIPAYLKDWRRFRALAGRDIASAKDMYPCLTDRVSSTPFDPHYFHQGAWLARQVAARPPETHVDVGSSVLMVSVLSATVRTVFVDYRPLRAKLSGLVTVAGDITHLPFGTGTVASLSCLHVIEHIGLGRYGDPVDPDGSAKGAKELARILAPGGRLYVSIPTGRERVCFNAHRVLQPDTVRRMFEPLRLVDFAFVDDSGEFRDPGDESLAERCEYGCGMYTFERHAV